MRTVSDKLVEERHGCQERREALAPSHHKTRQVQPFTHAQ